MPKSLEVVSQLKVSLEGREAGLWLGQGVWPHSHAHYPHHKQTQS